MGDSFLFAKIDQKARLINEGAHRSKKVGDLKGLKDARAVGNLWTLIKCD